MNGIQYEPYGIYLLLADIGQTYQWHVGIFVFFEEHMGIIYHATNANNDWEYETKVTENLASERDVLLALRIGTITTEDDLTTVDDTLAKVPVHSEGYFHETWGQDFNCWSWAKDALCALREAGILHFSCPAEDIESEARAEVLIARVQGERARCRTSRKCS